MHSSCIVFGYSPIPSSPPNDDVRSTIDWRWNLYVNLPFLTIFASFKAKLTWAFALKNLLVAFKAASVTAWTVWAAGDLATSFFSSLASAGDIDVGGWICSNNSMVIRLSTGLISSSSCSALKFSSDNEVIFIRPLLSNSSRSVVISRPRPPLKAFFATSMPTLVSVLKCL